MKKLVVLTISLLGMFILTACENTVEETPINVMNDKSTLGILSYVSTSFLDEIIVVNSVASRGITQLSFIQEVKSPATSIEDRLDLINIYVDKLKSFIASGTVEFSNIEELSSDRLEFEHMIKVIVDSDEYLLYYNEDLETHDVSGLFIFDGVEYVIQAENSISTSNDSDDSDIKHHMKLIAREGSNSIVVEYEMKEEDNETKQTFSIFKNINGVVDKLGIEIKTEDEDYVLVLTEDENEYKFKLDEEDEGQQAYKLDYKIDGTKGKVRIIESVNESGETVYIYRIQERSVKIDIEMEDPDNDDVSE